MAQTASLTPNPRSAHDRGFFLRALNKQRHPIRGALNRPMRKRVPVRYDARAGLQLAPQLPLETPHDVPHAKHRNHICGTHVCSPETSPMDRCLPLKTRRADPPPRAPHEERVHFIPVRCGVCLSKRNQHPSVPRTQIHDGFVRLYPGKVQHRAHLRRFARHIRRPPEQ